MCIPTPAIPSATPDPTDRERAECRDFWDRCRAPCLRSVLQFAQDELVFPTGPYVGRKFSSAYQPFAGLYLELLTEAHNTRRWNRFCITGPGQSGKSLLGFVLPCLYHLFEVQETVILGVPDMDMAGDKWREDLLPAIECSRYRDLLPRQGAGSRGGRVEAIRFRNNRTLKFMSGGGGDKSRAAFTSRVVVVTETDGFDYSSEASREADKFSQLEARTRAFGSRKCVYMECTVSTAEGRTWREYHAGTASRIVRPCPHCGQWVAPERADLRGWHDADSVVQARHRAHFACPACSRPWSEAQRHAANRRGRILHRGQSISVEGTVEGEPAETETLGFRWSAVDNQFATAGDLGADEWIASRESDEENAERRLCQFVWAIPPASSRIETTALSITGIAGRTGPCPKGVVPQETTRLTVGVDVGKWTCHWLAVAWSDDARGQVIDYGKIRTESDLLGEEKAVYAVLCDLRDEVFEQGFPWEGHDQNRLPDQVWIDSGAFTSSVYAFVRASNGHRYRPTKGQGSGQRRQTYYHKPRSPPALLAQGEGWHLAWMADAHVALMEIDSDRWKTWGHQRLGVPADQPGSVRLYKAPLREHLELARHLTAEKQVEDFVPGRGTVYRWERVRGQNHWFDAYYLACSAANFCGLELLHQQPTLSGPMENPRPRLTTPDGRPFFVLER